MDIEKYPPSEQIKRAFAVLRVLSGHTVKGLTPSEIGKAINEPLASNITRMLAQLNHLGIAEETREAGRWRLGPTVIQIATAHQLDVARAKSELDEIEQRYSRSR